MEVKTLLEDLAKVKQDILEKDKLLKESLDNQELLTRQLKSAKDNLIDAKYIIWDQLLKEVKKLKDYFIHIEDEKQLTSSCLANLLGPYTTHATPILLLCSPYKPTNIIVVPLH